MDPQSNPWLVIIIFLCIFIILGLIIWLIIVLVPRENVKLFGKCTHQTECDLGLVCSSSSMAALGTICLGGISQVCTITSDCATGLTCESGVCSALPQQPPVVTTIEQPELMFQPLVNNVQFIPFAPMIENSLTINNFNKMSNPQVLTPITSLSALRNNNLVFAADKKKLRNLF